MKRYRPLDSDDSALSQRLHDEMKRLKIKTEAVAAACNVSWRMVYYWQVRTTCHHPDSHHLKSLHEIGFDVTYLVTGVRLVSIADDCNSGENTHS